MSGQRFAYLALERGFSMTQARHGAYTGHHTNASTAHQTDTGTNIGTDTEGANATPDGRSTELRDSPMMAHLLDDLQAGTDIGHYGRLVFVMIARHFMSEDEMVPLLAKQPDHDATEAQALIQQVEAKGYSPPRRERILAWQKEQDYPICPNPDDPDSGNVYGELRFPDDVYEHISEYYAEKAHEGQ